MKKTSTGLTCRLCGSPLFKNDFTGEEVCRACRRKILFSTSTIPFYNPVSNLSKYFQEGWVCPKCGAVMNPNEKVCVNCNGRKKNGKNQLKEERKNENQKN